MGVEMKKVFNRIRQNVWRDNEKNIAKLLEANKEAVFIDIGCDNGENALKRANKVGAKEIHGIEVVESRLEMARNKGINVKEASANEVLPYEDGTFDVLTANQVIEHLYDTDLFISEIYRILKKGGYAVISTENASSWHNIIALIMGWQMFSLTNVCLKNPGLGNSVAAFVHKNDFWGEEMKPWQHMRIFAFKGFREVFEAHGFKVEKMLGAGYMPFYGGFAKIDKRHATWIAVKVRKV